MKAMAGFEAKPIDCSGWDAAKGHPNVAIRVLRLEFAETQRMDNMILEEIKNSVASCHLHDTLQQLLRVNLQQLLEALAQLGEEP